MFSSSLISVVPMFVIFVFTDNRARATLLWDSPPIEFVTFGSGTMKTLFDQTYDGLKEEGLSEVLFVKGGVGSVYSEAHFFLVVFPWIAVKGSPTMGSILLR